MNKINTRLRRQRKTENGSILVTEQMLVPGGGDDSLHSQLISNTGVISILFPPKVQITSGMRAEWTRARLNPLSVKKKKKYYSLVSLRHFHQSQVRFVTFPLSCQSFLQLEHDINMDIINKY